MKVSGQILVAGAINTDLVASVSRAPDAGETVTGNGFAIHGGGKGANQAVAVARSGGDVALLGAVGDDEFGRGRLADLRADGIDTAWVMVLAGETTGVALIMVDAGGENRIAYVPGATRAVPGKHGMAAFGDVQPSLILATNELPEAVLRQVFAAARQAGVTVVFNATPEPEGSRQLIRDASILIVNQGEAAALLDGEAHANPEIAVAALRKLGPDTVIVTLGADGACAGSAQGFVWHRPPEVAVVDTTGAGDTFCGAFVAEFARTSSIDEATRFGVVASALSVTRPGAQSSIPTRREILRFTG